MKLTINKPIEINLKWLQVNAYVRYWEDAEINGVECKPTDEIPCKQNDMWCPLIDIDNGIISNWINGVAAHIHYKVADGFSCILMSEEFEHFLFIKDDYVPSFMCPQRNGYGDYIIMNIDGDGKILDFKFNQEDLENFEQLND